MNQDHQAFASAVLCPLVLSLLGPAQPAVPQGMLLLAPAGMLLLSPAGMLGAGSGGTRGLRVRVLPMSCRRDRAAYAATIIVIPGPTGQTVPSKGPKRGGKVSREGQQKD